MIVARTSLIAPPGPSERLSVQTVCDLLWLHVTPADQVEHLRVQTARHGFEIAWFMLSENLSKARENALGICRNTIASTPALSNWQAA